MESARARDSGGAASGGLASDRERLAGKHGVGVRARVVRRLSTGDRGDSDAAPDHRARKGVRQIVFRITSEYNFPLFGHLRREKTPDMA